MNNPGKKDPLTSFTIIVPAHMEEGYIEKTILSLKELDYPREKLAVIIVENGSQDRTDEIIRSVSPDWFQVLTCPEPGVSKAKNQGIAAIPFESGWVIFLDADTFFKKGFLLELNAYLHTNAAKNQGCGMVSLRPWPDTPLARGWYDFYNFANRLVHTTRSIQLIRRDLLRDFRFDEALTFDEDTFMLRQCLTRSKYFYVQTRQVFSSIRRFEMNGWFRQLLQWISYASSSYEKKKTIQYKVLR
jgi:glycosyltransferase involved in cell wall biosynthesis